MTTPQPAFQIPTPPSVGAAPSPVSPTSPAPSPAPMDPGLKLDEMVLKYRTLRDKKKAVADRHRDELKPYNDALDQLGSVLLDALNRAGSESTRTSNGTVFKSMRSSYTVDDPAVFRQWLEANNKFDLLETRVSKESVEAYVASGAAMPPGIKISSEVTINVRK